MERNLDFFLNKSYNDDISTQETPLLKYIDDFKEVYPTLEESIKNEFVDYIMTLTYLSYIYFK